VRLSDTERLAHQKFGSSRPNQEIDDKPTPHDGSNSDARTKLPDDDGSNPDARTKRPDDEKRLSYDGSNLGASTKVLDDEIAMID
jgi:hypothetical protein